MNPLRSGPALIGAVILGLLLVAAVTAPLLAPYDPAQPVGPSLASPSGAHPLGTNNLGQDVASRLIWGARSTLLAAATAVGLAVSLGVLVGVGAGLAGGWPDLLAARTIDLALAVPRLPLLILIAAFAGVGGPTVAVLIGVLMWPAVARVVRSQTLTLRQRGYVRAARGFGASWSQLLRRHLLPGLAPLLIAETIVVASATVLLEASLAFLGLADPTRVSWGLDLHRALLEPGVYFSSAWLWWVLPAGALITMAILAFTLLGVGVERRWQPRVERVA
ncbi:ABC transporter permease [Natronosporangium hydrolyticum]|uniref:ABC transporter permease n=1 Tax=Natronosporangium hydrolyticum TaxID=2811111 RepID=A0A895YPR8_9ACTN|nr:ABC transporter permease [Natronosporangium hydrolyticum]QSB17479.1 ABC transporter permease [Natronosporangium hydrolyticum]